MNGARDRAIDLIFGRWRTQTLYAGVELGVFEVVGEYPKHAVEIADQLDVDRDPGYRLLRALGSLGVLEESPDRRFSITPAGELFQADHPGSLRDVVRLEEGPTHYALWKHLPDLVREGNRDAFQREFGHSGFEHREADPAYADAFEDAMTCYSATSAAWIAEMLEGDDFGFDVEDVSHVCGVGGHGRLLRSLLDRHPNLEGTVLEHPNGGTDGRRWALEMGGESRHSAVSDDVVEAVPEADVYLVASVPYGRSDEEYARILSTVREAAPADARLLLIDHAVPGPESPHLAKLFDVHMLVCGGGRGRTDEEYANLLENAGWRCVDTHCPANELAGAVEAVPDRTEIEK